MKKCVAVFGLLLPCLLNAQQLTLPPTSNDDGIVTSKAGVNGAAAYWGSPSTLGAYRLSGDYFEDPLIPGAADSHLGLVWNNDAPTSVVSIQQRLSASGGVVRAIFVGETAGWLDDFGYTYSGNPSGPRSFTAWQQIQSFGPSPSIQFGDYFEVPLAPGEMANFDFWLSATGTFGPRPTSPTELGGVYTLFKPQAGSVQTAQSLWATSPLAVETWIPSTATAQTIDTYLVSMEDWRVDRGSDKDYNDFRLALQFFNADGSPLTTIPEPGTWAFICGLCAFGFVLVRRSRVQRPV